MASHVPPGETTEADPSDSGGSHAYIGFEYQFLATVWLALELLPEGRADVLEIEPASEEDIEAELKTEPDEASAELVLSGRLLVQVKHRSSQWTPAAFRQVFDPAQDAPVRRESAKTRLLANADHRYLLVTNAQLNPELRPLAVEEPLAAPPRGPVSTKLTRGEPDWASLEGRVAISAQRVWDALWRTVAEMLVEDFSVPPTRVDACRRELMEAVRARLLRRAPTRWSWEQVRGVIRAHGGLPQRPSTLDEFVPPRNFAEIRARVENLHGLLLYGPPGSGKTALVEWLKHEYRTRSYEVRQPTSPTELREQLGQPGRILFELEDPWGKFKEDPRADQWSELPSLMKRARWDKKILVTSRHSLLHELRIDVGEEFQARAVFLGYDSYGEEERLRILLNKTQDAQPWQRKLLLENQGRIIAAVHAPISLERISRQVTALKSPGDFEVDHLIRTSSTGELAKLLVKELRALTWDALPPAVLLWALLSRAFTTSFQRSDATSWARFLREGSGRPFYLDRLLRWMATTNRLRVGEAEQTYRAHPITMAGLEELLRTDPDVMPGLLERLLSGLLDADLLEDASLVATKIPKFLQLSPEFRSRLQRRLREQLVRAEPDRLSRLLSLASTLLEGEHDPVSLLVTGLTGTERTQDGWVTVGSFAPPAWTGEELVMVHASVEARDLTERYVRFVLPKQYFDAHGAHARWLWSIGWDLSDAFKEAALGSLGKDDSELEEVVHGAMMATSPPFEELLEWVLHAIHKLDRQYSADAPKRRQAQEKELDELAAYYYLQQAGEESYPLHKVLFELVIGRRRREGYRWILEHPRRDDLLRGWAEFFRLEANERDFDAWSVDSPTSGDREVRVRELRELFHACVPDKLWIPLLVFPSGEAPELAPELLDLLVNGDESHGERVLRTLRWQLPPSDLRKLLAERALLISSRRRAVIRLLAQSKEFLPAKPGEENPHVQAITEALPHESEPALRACIEADTEQPQFEDATLKALRPADLAALKEWAMQSETRLGRAALVSLAAAGGASLGEIEPAFHSPVDDTRFAAMLALVFARAPGASEWFLKALHDAHYRCRVAAVHGLAQEANEAERAAILALAKDRSGPVRLACIAEIRDRKWVDGFDALCDLLSDDWNQNYGDGEENPVAVAAAGALGSFEALPEQIVHRVLAFLRKGPAGNRDIRVQSKLIDVLEQNRVPELLPLLTELLSEFGHRVQAEDEATRFRQIVANGLIRYLVRNPEEREHVDLAPFLALLNEPSPALGLILWMSLGIIGRRVWAQAGEHLATKPDHAQEKATLLLLASTRVGAAPGPDEDPTRDLLPASSPVRTVAEWLDQSEPTDLAQWNERWRRAPDCFIWVTALQSGDPWRRSIFSRLETWFGEVFRKSLLGAE